MNDPTHPVGHSLIACSSCGKDMSPDADACPACGGPNAWVHPILARVIDHLNTLPQETRFEARGHRMAMQCSYQTPRQAMGTVLMFGGIACFVIGFFVPAFVMIGLFCIIVGGLLTLFGLSAMTRHELNLDLHVPGTVVGTCDTKFWKDVLAIIRASPGQDDQGPKPPAERPMWS